MLMADDPIIVIATHNRDKVWEYQQLFPNHTIKGAYDFDAPEPEENGDSFEENAEIKAKSFFNHCQLPSIADDSGLSIVALDGAPGIFSARWAVDGDFIPAMEKIKDLLQGKQGSKIFSAAFFSCALCYYAGDQKHTVLGTCHGNIHFPARGKLGFGYDPIFIPDGETRTFGEMTIQEKNKFSHRNKAIAQLKQKLSI